MTTRRFALLIDGANSHSAARALGFDIDYRNLAKAFADRGKLTRAYYFTAIDEDAEFSSIRPLLDWLEYNGFTVVTKPAKVFVAADGTRTRKAGMNVEITTQALEIAPHVDEIVVMSGDGELRAMVEAAQRRGVRVTVASTNSTRPAMIADELRRQADEFIDLIHLSKTIGRDPAERMSRVREPARAD